MGRIASLYSLGFLLVCVAVAPVAAFPLKPIIEACSKADSLDQLIADLQENGWSALTSENFETFAEMMADNYLTVDQREWPESPIGRTWPEMRAKVIEDRFWYIEPQESNRILQKLDGEPAFVYLYPAPRTSCIMFLPENSFEKAEVESLVGSSKKWLTPIGYRQTKFMRKAAKTDPNFQIIASQATAAELKRAGSEAARTSLVLTIAKFKEDQNP
jgi:hypothetical protein